MAVSRLHPAPPPPTQHQQQHQQQHHHHHHHHHIASTLMSCVRESSPVEELEEATEESAECGGGVGGVGGGGGGVGGGGGEGRKQGRHETKKRRFHPLRGLRRIFRRKSRRSPEDGDRDVLPQSSSSAVASSSSFGGAGALNSDDRRNNESGGTSAAAAAAAAYGELDEAYRSRSASELLSGEEEEEEEEGSPGGSGRRRGSGGIASGEIFQDSLRHSVSHDSVFSSGERRATVNGGGSGGGGGRPSQPLAPSSSAQQVAAHQGVRAELFDAVRRRRWRGRSKDREEESGADRETGEAAAAAGRSSDDEEDLGLPRSPCNSPSSGEAGLRSDQKEIQSKSHSTCSEGSLLSMGSSDMDEDSQGQFSGHSSKLSLHEKSSSQYGSDLELDIGATAEPLSHSAARHKMSVRPKRTHGAPRLRLLKEVTSLGSLPTTPEVNEDSGRCSSPEISFNQETSSTEHIQVPSDNIKTASMPSAVAVEMSQRVSQSHQNAANSKSNIPPLCMNPQSINSSPKPSIQSVPEPSPLDSDKQDVRDFDYGSEDIYIQQAKQEMASSQNMPESALCSDVENGVVEEVVGMEETDSNGSNLLSRILSWRGSKKKIDEPPEGATCAMEGAPPSRRMDVHGRYVHEVICETEVVSGSAEQPPPSPGWRPAPFSTSWPPLIHSTPRSCHTSSRYIPPGREERGNNFSEEVTYSEWGTDFSGPHSLPLMMQCEAMEMSQEKPNIDRSRVNRQIFTSAAGTFPMNSRTKLPPSQSEAPVELPLSKSSSFKACRQEQQSIFSTSEAPGSLPVRFERSEFDSDFTMPSTESLVKVDTSNAGLVEKETSQSHETFLMTSVEGLLTLDVSGTSDVKTSDVTEQKTSESFIDESSGIDGILAEEWEEAHRDAEEEILTNSFISVPEDRHVGLIDDLESKVTLQHTKMEPEESFHYHSERNDDFMKMEDSFEPPTQKFMESQTSFEDQIVPSDSTPSSSQRNKRTQSVPASPSVSQTSDIPEFLRVQLIHVDSRPTTNVVLHSTGGVPVSINPPESNDTPGRRRLRPRSADGLESNQSVTKELVGVMSTSKSRITDDVNVVDNEKIGSSEEVVTKDKETSNDGKCKVSSRDSIGRVSQNEDTRLKEVSLAHMTQQKASDETSDKVGSTAGVAAPSKEKEEPVDQFHKALIRECSEITIQTEDIRPKEVPISLRMQRKLSDDKISSVPVISMKDREDTRYKTPVRESLGTVVVQNNENRASLPPKAQRKVSDESSVEVVPRRKSASAKDFGSQNKDDEPELFKVFARRSLKLKDSETWENHPPAQQQQRSRDSDKENDIGDNVVDVVILPITKEQKQRESLILRDVVDPQVKPSVTIPTDTPTQLRCISSNNGILPSASISGGNNGMQNNSIYGNDKVASVASEIPKIHRASVGSYPRREGPSPEKRPRGVSVNLPPESHPYRVEMNRGAAVSSDQRRPLWATQIQSDESYGKALPSEIADQPVELGVKVEDDVKPHFKRIQQRKEEWELRARMQ